MYRDKNESTVLNGMLEQEGNRVKQLEKENKELREQLDFYKTELDMIVMLLKCF